MARIERVGVVDVEYDDQRFGLIANGFDVASVCARLTRPANDLAAPSPRPAAAELAHVFASRLVRAGVFQSMMQRFTLVARVDATGPGPDPHVPRVRVSLKAGEQAIALVVSDGLVSWHGAPPNDDTVDRDVVIELGPPGHATATSPASDEHQGRQDDADAAAPETSVVLLRFDVSKVRNDSAPALDGPAVVMVSASDCNAWRRHPNLHSLGLRRDARVLLLLHDLLSTTIGDFGLLTTTSWGQGFLSAARQRYDFIIGIDHRTVSSTPAQNAAELVQTLSPLQSAGGEVDVICHGRGGQVLQALIELMSNDRGQPLPLRRTVFIAPVSDTPLASPAHWMSLANLATNLAIADSAAINSLGLAASPHCVTDQRLGCAATLARQLAGSRPTPDQVQGLAALRSGPARTASPGEPPASESMTERYAIVSTFDATQASTRTAHALALLTSDRERWARAISAYWPDDEPTEPGHDLLFSVPPPNQLASVLGGRLTDLHDFGRNALVPHTHFLLRPETVFRLAQWLRLPAPIADLALGPGVRLRDLTDFVDEDRQAPWTSDPFLPPPSAAPSAPPPPASQPAWRSASARREPSTTRGDAATAGSDAPEMAPAPPAFPADLPADVPAYQPANLPVDLPADLLAGAAKAFPTATLHALAEMPAVVPLDSLTQVVITLSREEIERAFDASTQGGQLDVDASAGATLLIDVVPRSGFDYPDDDTQRGRREVPIPPVGEPLRTAIDLVANEAGEGKVSVAIRQGSTRRLMLSLRCEVVASAAVARATPGSVAAASTLTESAPDRSVSLTIFDRRNAGRLQLEYILTATSADAAFTTTEDIYDRFMSPPLDVDPETYVRQTYERIEKAWRGTDGAIDRFEKDLAGWGGTMFRRLFPVELQRRLWSLVQTSTSAGVRVLSDEPFLPWEMVFITNPDDPDADGGKFFAELGVCRWLYGAAPAESIDVRKGHARYVVPHYPDSRWRLPGAEEIEEPLLLKLGLLPVEPRHEPVLELLGSKGEVDLLHFACHGTADPAQIDSAEILLEGEIVHVDGKRSWAREPLLASTVAEFARLRGSEGRRPLVVVNACQAGQAGRSLTGIGGFASAFLGTREGTGDSRGRAGAFIGALWSIGDVPATTFVKTLYEQLRKGMPMGSASRVARRAARQAGEASWLAYAVYAHPLLRVRWLE